MPLSLWRGVREIQESRISGRLFYSVAAVIIFAGGIGCFSQPRSNLEIFDREISARLDEVFYRPDIRRDVQFVFRVRSAKNSDEEVRFLVSVIKKAADRNKIRASFSSEASSADSVFNFVSVDIFEMRTKYPGFAGNKFLGAKLVRRNLYAMLKIEISGINYSYAGLDTIEIDYNDKVDLDDIETIGSEDYKFTYAKAPSVSFYEEIIFPAAIIFISVAAAVLFFTIRSK